MLYAVLVLAGIGLGIAFTTIFRKVKSVGVLVVAKSEPDEDPYLFLKLRKDVGDITKMEFVQLEVSVKR
jgi:hypothetical protein